MSFDTEPSVHALRTEAEATRARLTGTVEELRTQVADTATDIKERLSPSAIKAEVTEYVRDSRDQLWHSLEQKARDNPMQAVAVGAALAYPVLQLVRAMPAPLLLIGAGLLLSRATANQNDAATDAVRARAQGAMDHASGAVESATDSARRTLHDAQDYARDRVDTVMDRATEAVSSVKDRISGAAEDAKAAVSGTTDKITGQAADLAQQARTAVSGTWEQNPLLVAGVGLAIGAFIAAAFPATQAEESLFGEASDAVRRQADGLAAKGIEAAKGVVQGAAAAAGEQGLSAEGLTKVGEDLTGKVRAVAERGVEAALGEPKNPNT
jgi:ElaB/YqjD/DUF883 family membrane-anchored ribosome-binding protein